MNEKIRKTLFYVALITFCVSSGLLVNIFVIQPWINNSKTSEIQNIYNDDVGADVPEQINKFDLLHEVNQDIVGWITIDNTVIDYPVLKSSDDDPEYYLYKDYNHEKTKYGSIFIDSRSGDIQNSKNIIVHGHHMRDGSMFAKILNYKSLDFYKSTPVFTFDTVYENCKWKVFSVFRTNTLEKHGPVFNYLKGSFNTDQEFSVFLQDIKDRTLINTTVDVNTDDQLITLSTCSYEYDNFRTVVVARKVRKDEDPSVNVEEAVKNSNPVLPKVYQK